MYFSTPEAREYIQFIKDHEERFNSFCQELNRRKAILRKFYANDQSVIQEVKTLSALDNF